MENGEEKASVGFRLYDCSEIRETKGFALERVICNVWKQRCLLSSKLEETKEAAKHPTRTEPPATTKNHHPAKR